MVVFQSDLYLSIAVHQDRGNVHCNQIGIQFGAWFFFLECLFIFSIMITPQFSSSQKDFGISAVESVAILIFDIVFLFLIDFAIRSVYHI